MSNCIFHPSCTTCPHNEACTDQLQFEPAIPASWDNTPYSHHDFNPTGPYVEYITIHDVEWYQPAF